MSFSEITINKHHILYDNTRFENPEDITFESREWAQRDAITGYAEGRGTTFFVSHNAEELVLRHYHRGGMIATWLPDRYLWTGLQATRPWRELHLLQRMRDLGLPVPAPIAARVIRDGMFYTADIMTGRITNARTVAQLLCTQSLDTVQWQTMGSMIRRFHKQGIYHADLNANNILLDQSGGFHLIDFDRGAFRAIRHSWQQRNLQRLHRSLTKLKGKHEPFHFSEQNWQNLLQGYRQS